MNKLVVFIPAFNEEGSIEKTICELKSLENLFRENSLELSIVVVDDGSKDKTAEIAGKIEGVRVESHIVNRGLGATTRTAMRVAYEMGADIAIKLDADLQHNPKDILKVVEPLKNNEADICWGSRFKGKITYRMPLIRRMGNRFFTWVMRQLTCYDISDAQTGLMAFNRKYLAKFDLINDYNPPQQLLCDAFQKNMRYTEVPVVFNPRRAGSSFVNLRYPFNVLFQIFMVLLYAHPLRIFGGVGIVFIGLSFIGFAVHIVKIFLYSVRWDEISSVSIIMLLSGIMMFSFGVLSDILLYKKGR